MSDRIAVPFCFKILVISYRHSEEYNDLLAKENLLKLSLKPSTKKQDGEDQRVSRFTTATPETK
jgi:hypothetical protein